MQILIEIPNPPKRQEIIDIPLHFIDGDICEAGGYEFKVLSPHGRLIDRSVLFKEYQNLCKGLLCRECPFFNERNSCNIEEWILNQPTILEAEE